MATKPKKFKTAKALKAKHGIPVSNAPWLALALKEAGTKEWPGAKTNPKVSQYYKDAGFTHMADSVPWCAAFVGSMLRRSGIKPSGSLAAISYAKWGARCGPIPGAVVVWPHH